METNECLFHANDIYRQLADSNASFLLYFYQISLPEQWQWGTTKSGNFLLNRHLLLSKITHHIINTNSVQ